MSVSFFPGDKSVTAENKPTVAPEIDSQNSSAAIQKPRNASNSNTLSIFSNHKAHELCMYQLMNQLGATVNNSKEQLSIAGTKLNDGSELRQHTLSIVPTVS